jgi:putative transposase
VPEVVRKLGIAEQTCYRWPDELLNGEIFYTLREAKVLIERWREHYNHIRPHSSPGYRPPAPEMIAVPAIARYPRLTCPRPWYQLLC